MFDETGTFLDFSNPVAVFTQIAKCLSKYADEDLDLLDQLLQAERDRRSGQESVSGFDDVESEIVHLMQQLKTNLLELYQIADSNVHSMYTDEVQMSAGFVSSAVYPGILATGGFSIWWDSGEEERSKFSFWSELNGKFPWEWPKVLKKEEFRPTKNGTLKCFLLISVPLETYIKAQMSYYNGSDRYLSREKTKSFALTPDRSGVVEVPYQRYYSKFPKVAKKRR